MYASKEYQQIARDNINHLDDLFKKNKNTNKTKLIKNFKKSSILEKNFWQCFV